MRVITSALLTMALVAITSCSIGQKTIVGKWDCKFDGVDYANGKKDIFEYLADGTLILNLIPPSTVDLKPSQVTGQWKSIDNNRYSSTVDGKMNVTTYKFEGERLLFKSSSSEDYSIKCDRI